MERKEAATKHRAFDLSLKAKPDNAGHFSGYASVWDVVDSYREKVAPGAFVASLAETAAKGRTLPILWQHRTDEPIGQWDVLKEDQHGLYGEGTLWLDEAPYARLAKRGMGAGAITGLSVGYYVKDSSFDETTRIRTLKQVDLVEASIVTTPANDEARVDTVKAKLAAGETITEREFERLLKDRGFSRSDAAAIADGGFKAWAAGAGQPHQATNAGLGDLAKALAGFSLPKL
ncbi:HK97 family phage prohead protease [Jiella avicenniae]|uniref:HK97 family phage prohead protease n=1 Tax=Jiella avicenniae TaxID=2907202 RepID=A0A9X1T5A0_9HYPH|nr:HK97 family phage prohead protease [Jiella avicenniae]MCE7028932.1 HK97 family phage prohead protease [Jiella avicenniae]